MKHGLENHLLPFDSPDSPTRPPTRTSGVQLLPLDGTLGVVTSTAAGHAYMLEAISKTKRSGNSAIQSRFGLLDSPRIVQTREQAAADRDMLVESCPVYRLCMEPRRRHGRFLADAPPDRRSSNARIIRFARPAVRRSPSLGLRLASG